jgi:hypothetical protein
MRESVIPSSVRNHFIRFNKMMDKARIEYNRASVILKLPSLIHNNLQNSD